jgi:hypothetical protein
MRQKPNPNNQAWQSTMKRSNAWINSPTGVFVPPPPPPTMPFEYSDGVDILYTDSAAVNYV